MIIGNFVGVAASVRTPHRDLLAAAVDINEVAGNGVHPRSQGHRREVSLTVRVVRRQHFVAQRICNRCRRC